MSKYGNRKTTVDGFGFDSAKEARRYTELALLQRAGEISDLRRQIRYQLIPPQYIDGKQVERPVDYVADFVYVDNRTGRTVIEDVKSKATKKLPAYIIKRKLVLLKYGIRIREV